MDKDISQSQYNIYKSLNGKKVDTKQSQEIIVNELLTNMVDVENPKKKKHYLSEAQIDTTKINLATRPTKFRTKKTNTKLLRRPLAIKELKKDMSKLDMDLLKQMNVLWLEYIDSIVSPSTLCQCIVTADLHGAIINIVQSKKSIICWITRTTLTTPVQIKTIPKHVVNMQVTYKEHMITLFGRNWDVRPAERATKKYNTFKRIDL
ncbi:Uncharacterized protein QTN25_004404 [Entamoeba marina]